MVGMIEARAVRIEGKGGTEVLTIGPLSVREPGPGEILVQVAAAGLNRADILQRKGFYPAPPGVPSDVPGLEYAGTVAQCGPGVTERSVGEPVMGIVAGGGMATHVVVHAREAVRVPEGMELVEAAAVPEVFMTAYDALMLQAEVALGEVVLLHAVGSGVGTAALQLCKIAGARVLGTSRTQDKLERCRQLGLSEGIVTSDKKFAAQVREATGGRGADVILDSVGAAYLGENLTALAPRGRLVVLGLMGGASGDIPLGLLLSKRLHILGTVLRSRPLEEKAALAQAFGQHVVPLLADGRLKPVLDRVMPIDEVAAAHDYLESNQSLGKVVLRWQ